MFRSLSLVLFSTISFAAVIQDYDTVTIFSSPKYLHTSSVKKPDDVASAGHLEYMILGSLGLPTVPEVGERILPDPDVFHTVLCNIFIAIEHSKQMTFDLSSLFQLIETYPLQGDVSKQISKISLSNSNTNSNDGKSSKSICLGHKTCDLISSGTNVAVDQSSLLEVQALVAKLAPSLSGNQLFENELAKILSIRSTMSASDTSTDITVVLSSLKHLKASEQVVAVPVITKAIEILITHMHQLFGDRLLAEVVALRGELSFTMEKSFSNNQRRLQETSPIASANETAGAIPTSEDIARFQVILWTSVLLVVVLVTAIGSLFTMDVGRDSLLYAKFQTDGTHRKID